MGSLLLGSNLLVVDRASFLDITVRKEMVLEDRLAKLCSTGTVLVDVVSGHLIHKRGVLSSVPIHILVVGEGAIIGRVLTIV